MRQVITTIALASGLIVMMLGTAKTEEIKVFSGRTPSTEELINALGTNTKLKFRGLSIQGKAERQPYMPAVALDVKFEFDSAELSDQARTVLRQLGEALRSDKLGRSKFLVEGHTDSLGTDAYNMWLSEHRAAAVRNFLIIESRVAPERLVVTGKGETSPLDPSDPTAGVNRRVEVVNLGQ